MVELESGSSGRSSLVALIKPLCHSIVDLLSVLTHKEPVTRGEALQKNNLEPARNHTT
jgi:hypothetical protein